MHRYRRPHRYVLRYPPVIRPRRSRLTPSEIRWRLRWPYIITLILATLMLLFTLIIFVLEIASLTIDGSQTLSNTASTGAGIWCSISFIVAIVFTYLLVLAYDCSHRWSTYTLMTHLITLIFICILIGLDANAVTPYNTMVSTAPIKIQVLKGQLAVAIVMLLIPILFLAVYIYTAFIRLLPLRAHASSVHLPLPIPIKLTKY